MSKITDFLKNNAGNAANVAFSAPDIANLARGKNILGSIGNIIANIAVGTQVWQFQLSKLFAGIGTAVKGLITSTGSLNAAMTKLKDTEAAQKSFRALGVSAAGAMAEIKKLATLSASKGISFEEVSRATQNLISLSRGAMGTADDMEKLIDVSKATGASLDDLAQSAGGVSEAMRNGDAIDASIDRLRAIGAISDSSATSLKNLQKAGASVFSVQSGLDDAMKKTSSKGSDGIAEVEQQHSGSIKEAQKAVGSPWVKGDIETTKNYTEALKAITPVLAEISGFFAAMFARVGAWTSWMVKSIAGTWLFQAGLKATVVVLTLLAAGVSIVTGTKLVNWLRSSTSGFADFTNKVRAGSAWLLNFSGKTAVVRYGLMAMEAALVATKWALISLEVASVVLAVFALLSTVISALTGNTEGLAKEMDAAAKASKDFNDELMDQANHIVTLADKHAILQKALKASVDAWEAVRKKQKEVNDSWYSSDEDKTRIAQLTRAARDADSTVVKVASTPISKAEEAVHGVEKGLSDEQIARDTAMSKATPYEAVALHEKEAKRLQALADAGELETTGAIVTREKASQNATDKAVAIKDDATAGGPEARAVAVSEAEAELKRAVNRNINLNAARPEVVAEHEANLASARAKVDAAKAAQTAGVDTSRFDLEEARIKRESDSQIMRGEGMKTQAELARKDIGKPGAKSKEELDAQEIEGEALITKGKKAKADQFQNSQSAAAEAETARKTKIQIDLENDLADAALEASTSMKEGYGLLADQSAARIEALKKERDAYKLAHPDANEKTDAFLKENAAKTNREKVEQIKTTLQKAAATQQSASQAAEARDTSIGAIQEKNQQRRAVTDAEAALKAFKDSRLDDPLELEKRQAAVDSATKAEEEGRKQREFTKMSAEREMKVSDAQVSGNSDEILKQEDAAVYQQKYEQLRQIYGADKADTMAKQFADNAIKMDGNRMARETDQSAAVSSLARIGGGGGVENVDTQLDVTRRIRDIGEEQLVVQMAIRDRKEGVVN